MLVYRILFVASFVFSFLGGIYRVREDMPTTFSYVKFLLTLGILLFIVTFSTFMTYWVYLKKVQQDVRDRLKTVEGHRITKKVFVPAKNTYHFYIDSPVKLSIEVTPGDFAKYLEGDEVFIEYASHCKQYFGYF